jgi:pilus assembly protein CpaE
MDPRNVLLLASGRDLIEASEAAVRAGAGRGLTVLPPCDPRSLNGSLSNAAAVVLELDFDRSDALSGFADLARHAPSGCKLIAAARNARSETVRDLFRSGAADVLTGPFTAQAFGESLRDALASGEPPRGKVVAVLKAAGGVGATTVAAGLAASLQTPRKGGRAGRRTAVLDLDLQFGDLALAFDAEPRHTVLDALASRQRLDRTYLEGLLTDTEDGVRLLAAPPGVTPLDAMDAATGHRLIADAAAGHDLVLIDLPATWTDWTAPVLQAADAIVLVVGPTVAGAAGARRVLTLLAEAGVGAEVLLVVNRCAGLLDGRERAGRIARAIDLEPVAVLPEDAAAAKAADRGRPVTAFAPSSGLAKALDRAAQALDARLFAPAAIART